MPGETDISEMSPPAGFEDLDQLENMSVDRLKSQPLVNVFGVVKSFQPPIKTRGTDWKCTVEIIDASPYPSRYGMKVNFFASPEKMPKIDEAGAILRMEKIKVQMRDGRVSLIKNNVTKYLVIPLSDLKKASSRPESVPTMASKYQISSRDMSYAIWLHQHILEGSVPNNPVFQLQTEQAMSNRDKYSQLKDVKADKFYDLLGEVIHKYERDGIMTTVYLSDYTAHTLFYDYKWSGSRSESRDEAEGGDGDEYGYTKGLTKSEGNDWPGPYGKLSIQLTLFDEHASSMRNFKVGQWMFMRNVQLKMGRDRGHLEGFLRGGKGGISLIDKFADPDEIDPRYKEAIRRKRAYEQDFRKKSQGKEAAVSVGGTKRKSESTSKSNSKRLRKEKRAVAEEKRVAEENKLAAAKKVAIVEENNAQRLVLNNYVKCNHPDQPTLSLSEFLDPKNYKPKEEWGLDSPPPFLNRKFRANVRVVDFFPDKLEDFALGRITSEYDVLSDHSSSEDSDPEEEKSPYSRGRAEGGPKTWSWQFTLRVEDASLSDDANPKKRMWLLVDNSNAQFLLGLDADDLCQNNELLIKLRRQLEILWGDLEERKSSVLEKLEQIESEKLTEAIHKNRASRSGTPSLDSDGESASLAKVTGSTGKIQPLTSRDVNLQSASLSKQQKKDSIITEFHKDPKVKNRAFTCCVYEYGIKNKTTGKTEDRKFGMFGTRIVAD